MTLPVQAQDVLAPTARAAIFLVVTVRPGAEDDVRGLLADVAGLTRAVGFRDPEVGLTCVVGIGTQLWDRLYDHPRPAGQLMNRLDGRADVIDEVHGFRFFDERDLLGFVDGTESPRGAAAVAAVFIGDEDPVFAGGSYVVVQKYLHDLAAWNALPVELQELVIGRRKLSDIELPDDVKPSDSHVVATTIVDASGAERQIVRDNMPFGTVGAREFGTYFIGYASDPDVIEQMLRNMFVGDPPGNHDRILDFSTAVTGGLFFVPKADFLDAPPVGPGASTTTPAVRPGTDGSLVIGSLRRSRTS